MAQVHRNATMIRVAGVMSVALAIAGCTHGFFEMLQGFKPTGGFYINSVGAELGLWGEDPAVTIVHNFLLTGALAFGFGILAIIWSLFYLDRRHGALVLLALFVAQTAFGGGGGYVPFYLVLFAWATRIDKPLHGLAGLPAGLRHALAPVAEPLAYVSTLLWIACLTESIVGFSAPLLGDQTTLYAIWTGLLIVLVLMNIAFVAAAAKDLGRRKQPAS